MFLKEKDLNSLINNYLGKEVFIDENKCIAEINPHLFLLERELLSLNHSFYIQVILPDEEIKAVGKFNRIKIFLQKENNKLIISNISNG